MVTPTGVPLASVAPVIVTETPVTVPWFAVTPPLVTIDEVVPTAIVPASLEMPTEKVPEPAVLALSPV